MEPWAAFVLLLGAVLGLPWALLGGLDLLKRWAWLRAGRRLGLRFEPGGLLAGDALHGRRNGWAIWILAHHRRRTLARLRLPELPDGVELRASGWLKPPGAAALGERTFDRRVWMQGPEGPLRARLNRESREKVARRLQNPPGPLGAQLWVSRGEVAFACPGMILLSRRLERVVVAMEELAAALSPQEGVPDRLAQIALDPDEPQAVREGAIRTLVLRYDRSTAAERAARALLSAPQNTLRLWAGRCLSRTAEGGAVLQALAQNANNPDALRAEALRRMTDVEPISVRATALAILRSGPAKLRTIAAERLSAYPDSLPDLADRARTETHAATQLAILQSILRAARTPLACQERESALIDLLDSPHRSVRLAAIQGLARVGSRDAIQPLKGLRRSRWHDPSLARQVAHALSHIRGRLGPAQAGRLSLSDVPPDRTAEGGLSVVATEAGALSHGDPTG